MVRREEEEEIMFSSNDLALTRAYGALILFAIVVALFRAAYLGWRKYKNKKSSQSDEEYYAADDGTWRERDGRHAGHTSRSPKKGRVHHG